MTTMVQTTNDEDDDEVLSGSAVVELHPDRSAVAGLDFDDSYEPLLPMLFVACGQFTFKISPGRDEVSEHDIRFAERVAEAAVAFRDRVLALAITQSQARAALPARVPPTPGVS